MILQKHLSLSFSLLLLLVLYTPSTAQIFKQVNIQIEQDSIDKLERQPYSNEDVHGDFFIDAQGFEHVELHYRGAFNLFNLIRAGSIRNWKVKFPKDNKLENRREWNFNYETYIRQNLAYQIFKAAKVPVVSAENVLLSVNRIFQGLYLKYEDPDNSDWLKETFGDNDGDLYKAAYDLPGEVKYFADLTYLGDEDADYFLHYRKQTNKKGLAEFDYSSIRDFTVLINQTPDDEFEQMILDNFDVVSFIKYLVIANYMAHWDSYPYRPKNFFLYDNPADDKWHFIPWDLDATFQESGNRNPIGTTGSIYYYFDSIVPYQNEPTEPLERPLVWRIMKIKKFRDKYCYEYKQAIDSYLNSDSLFEMIDSIETTVNNNVTGQDRIKFIADVAATKRFINKRLPNVKAQLDACNVIQDPFNSTTSIIEESNKPIIIYPNPASNYISIELPTAVAEYGQIILSNVLGQTVSSLVLVQGTLPSIHLSIDHISSGQYFLTIKVDEDQSTRKLLIIKH